MNISTLLSLALFKGISEEALLPFVLSTPNAMRCYKAAEFVACQGDVCRSLFILCNGEVRTQMVNAEGKQLTIERIQAPSLLAPAFIFATENRFPVNVETIVPSEVLVLNKELFLDFMHQQPSVMRNFITLISDRSLFLSKRLNEFALQSLKERLLNYLQMHGSIANQQEVALVLGVARPSLARALAELQDEGRILMKGKEIIVRK